MITKLLTILSMLISLLTFGACSSSKPEYIGKDMTAPSPCPDSPNCVSTLAIDAEHGIKSIAYTGTQEEAHQKITEIILGMDRSEIQASEPHYIYATYTTFLMRFVDDVEFFFDDTLKVIHFRSASRLGYSDMGVNRKRMEKIRSQFQ